jgi:nitroimidazol reductase NimA-like FMN-containing flavoprotein (pyridoxamine 5'-phosphate oxidase superfamily)
MEQEAIEILNAHRIMAISTVRPDGWPQTTIVGYANDGLRLYFLISRKSQKFANIQRDKRVSVAIGQEPSELSELQAVYAAGNAYEVTGPEEGKLAWRLLAGRHPNLAAFDQPDQSDVAMMAAQCDHLSVLDFAKGLGPGRIVTHTRPASPPSEPAGSFDTPI